jgi:hypothetical protein
MAKHEVPSAETLLSTIRTCIRNGERLIEETYDLEFRKPPSSRFFLIMIAQEELAKAFILCLVKERIVPFTPPVLRAMNDHACKQLVSMIMDYLIMHWDDLEELEAEIRKDGDLGGNLPADVNSAMELLRYEKIGRWDVESPILAEPPNYDPSARRIAEGKKDRHKQDALYVRIGRNGQVISTPETISEDETRSELERVNRYKYFVNSLLDGVNQSDRYQKAMAALTLLFAGATAPQ